VYIDVLAGPFIEITSSLLLFGQVSRDSLDRPHDNE
jgi:hypothetical protein